MKRSLVSATLLGSLVALALGCASTRYHAYSGGRDGGYQDQRIDDTTYTVTFFANHSSDDLTRRNLMLRCGDIAFQHGYAYFTLASLTGGDNEMAAIIKLRKRPT